MLIKDLKSIMLLPEKEIFINKIVKIRGNDVYLMSLTLEENRNVLWVMYEAPYYMNKEIDMEDRIEHTTNRDKMIHNIDREMYSAHIHISELVIQNQKITFSFSSASALSHTNYEGYMQLQHFIENGLDTTSLDEVDVSNLVIASYVQNENEGFPLIDLSKELHITLKIMKDFKKVLIDPPLKPISTKFGKVQEDNKFYFYDCIENKNRTFYINEIKHYDVWEEMNKQLEGELARTLPKNQIASMKEELLKFLPIVCPKGMNLALLVYESEDNIQLDFYSKEYLDERPVYNTSSTGTIYGFKPDEEFGYNGFKNRICMIKPVEKDFNGSVDVELFSWYMEIPEEIITVD